MIAIEVKNITKIYKLYDRGMDRLKEAINFRHKSYHKSFYALNNISFSINEGENIGIIGTNGSGKSTILKIITGVLRATEGQLNVNGKISALLELGAGFDPDYTGIENIYMNGSVLGYTREEMDVKKEEILKFADIGDFVHHPVKTYSSGMLVRLAFALAINVEPEILIVDEALAVGDAFFQTKCFHKLDEIKRKGTTILFVSHDLASVKKMCSRAIWLDNGILREDGDVNAVCERYMAAQIERNNRESEKLMSQLDFGKDMEDIKISDDKISFPSIELGQASAVSGTGKAEVLSFYIKDDKGKYTNLLKSEGRYQFGLVAHFKEKLEHVIFGLEMENLKGVRVFGVNNFMEQKCINYVERDKIYEVTFDIILPRICKGEYLLTPAVASGIQENHIVHMRVHNGKTIYVENEGYNIALIEFPSETKIIEHEEKNVIFE